MNNTLNYILPLSLQSAQYTSARVSCSCGHFFFPKGKVEKVFYPVIISSINCHIQNKCQMNSLTAIWNLLGDHNVSLCIISWRGWTGSAPWSFGGQGIVVGIGDQTIQRLCWSRKFSFSLSTFMKKEKQELQNFLEPNPVNLH